MKKTLLYFFGTLVICLGLFSSCKKTEDAPAKPTISFKTESGYTSTNVAIHIDEKAKIGFSAAINGTDNLVKFNLTANGQSIVDSTINSSTYTIEMSITKSSSEKELWIFSVKTLSGITVSDTIILTRNFDINSFLDNKLGAQNNTTVNTFFSLSDNIAKTYNKADAFANQAKIDIFCFYEAGVNNTALSSPGAGITGIFSGTDSPDNYTTKNTTSFQKTTLTTTAFDAVVSDTAIFSKYNDAITTGIKKAKLLVVGDVYAFKLHSGKKGLFKVKEVAPNNDGYVIFDVKVQK